MVGGVRVPQRPSEASEAARRPLLLRRSRGYVPDSIPLAIECEAPILACGAELKNTFCLAKGRRAWVGPHIGDLRSPAALQSFREGIEHFERLFAVTPELVAHDLHPDYLSTRYALEREGVEPVGVQHHHAHLAACLAEHGVAGPAIGAIYDGTGYGTDGTVWGGELLVGGLSGFERAATLWRTRMPGGEAAIREPWRMACAWLIEALGEEPPIPTRLRGRVEARAWQGVSELARSGLASPLTTSVGRLFDAIAALCGIRATVGYEGQAAFELQAACDEREPGAYPITLAGTELLELDPRETIRSVAADAAAGVAPGVIAARFHAAIARATVDACAAAASTHGVDVVVLSGGVFQNRRLLESVGSGLHAAGLRVLVPERLPINDGGIAYGQAAVAAARTGACLGDTEAHSDEILGQTVFVRGANRPFGELTVDDARGRADELRAAVGWGPTARVAPVARSRCAMAAVVLGLHVVGFFLLIALVAPHHYHLGASGAFAIGTGVTAYTLGMRHAFDADHISAIDNTTRKLMSEGKRPLSVGFFFSLGHSTIVFVLAFLLAIGVKALAGQVQDDGSTLHTATSWIGTPASPAPSCTSSRR